MAGRHKSKRCKLFSKESPDESSGGSDSTQTAALDDVIKFEARVADSEADQVGAEDGSPTSGDQSSTRRVTSPTNKDSAQGQQDGSKGGDRGNEGTMSFKFAATVFMNRLKARLRARGSRGKAKRCDWDERDHLPALQPTRFISLGNLEPSDDHRTDGDEQRRACGRATCANCRQNNSSVHGQKHAGTGVDDEDDEGETCRPRRSDDQTTKNGQSEDTREDSPDTILVCSRAASPVAKRFMAGPASNTFPPAKFCDEDRRSRRCPPRRSCSQLHYPTYVEEDVDAPLSAAAAGAALQEGMGAGICISQNRLSHESFGTRDPKLTSPATFVAVQHQSLDDFPRGLASVLSPKFGPALGFQIQRRFPRGLAAVVVGGHHDPESSEAMWHRTETRCLSDNSDNSDSSAHVLMETQCKDGAGTSTSCDARIRLESSPERTSAEFTLKCRSRNARRIIESGQQDLGDSSPAISLVQTALGSQTPVQGVASYLEGTRDVKTANAVVQTSSSESPSSNERPRDSPGIERAEQIRCLEMLMGAKRKSSRSNPRPSIPSEQSSSTKSDLEVLGQSTAGSSSSTQTLPEGMSMSAPGRHRRPRKTLHSGSLVDKFPNQLNNPIFEATECLRASLLNNTPEQLLDSKSSHSLDTTVSSLPNNPTASNTLCGRSHGERTSSRTELRSSRSGPGHKMIHNEAARGTFHNEPEKSLWRSLEHRQSGRQPSEKNRGVRKYSGAQTSSSSGGPSHRTTSSSSTGKLVDNSSRAGSALHQGLNATLVGRRSRSSDTAPSMWALGQQNTYAKLLADARKSQMMQDEANAALTLNVHAQGRSKSQAVEAAAGRPEAFQVYYSKEVSEGGDSEDSTGEETMQTTVPFPGSTSGRAKTMAMEASTSNTADQRWDHNNIRQHIPDLQSEAACQVYKNRMTSITHLLNRMNSITQLLNTMPLHAHDAPDSVVNAQHSHFKQPEFELGSMSTIPESIVTNVEGRRSLCHPDDFEPPERASLQPRTVRQLDHMSQQQLFQMESGHEDDSGIHDEMSPQKRVTEEDSNKFQSRSFEMQYDPNSSQPVDYRCQMNWRNGTSLQPTEDRTFTELSEQTRWSGIQENHQHQSLGTNDNLGLTRELSGATVARPYPRNSYQGQAPAKKQSGLSRQSQRMTNATHAPNLADSGHFRPDESQHSLPSHAQSSMSIQRNSQMSAEPQIDMPHLQGIMSYLAPQSQIQGFPSSDQQRSSSRTANTWKDESTFDGSNPLPLTSLPRNDEMRQTFGYPAELSHVQPNRMYPGQQIDKTDEELQIANQRSFKKRVSLPRSGTNLSYPSNHMDSETLSSSIRNTNVTAEVNENAMGESNFQQPSPPQVQKRSAYADQHSETPNTGFQNANQLQSSLAPEDYPDQSTGNVDQWNPGVNSQQQFGRTNRGSNLRMSDFASERTSTFAEQQAEDPVAGIQTAYPQPLLERKSTPGLGPAQSMGTGAASGDSQAPPSSAAPYFPHQADIIFSPSAETPQRQASGTSLSEQTENRAADYPGSQQQRFQAQTQVQSPAPDTDQYSGFRSSQASISSLSGAQASRQSHTTGWRTSQRFAPGEAPQLQENASYTLQQPSGVESADPQWFNSNRGANPAPSSYPDQFRQGVGSGDEQNPSSTPMLAASAPQGFDKMRPRSSQEFASSGMAQQVQRASTFPIQQMENSEEAQNAHPQLTGGHNMDPRFTPYQSASVEQYNNYTSAMADQATANMTKSQGLDTLESPADIIYQNQPFGTRQTQDMMQSQHQASEIEAAGQIGFESQGSMTARINEMDFTPQVPALPQQAQGMAANYQPASQYQTIGQGPQISQSQYLSQAQRVRGSSRALGQSPSPLGTDAENIMLAQLLAGSGPRWANLGEPQMPPGIQAQPYQSPSQFPQQFKAVDPETAAFVRKSLSHTVETMLQEVTDLETRSHRKSVAYGISNPPGQQHWGGPGSTYDESYHDR